jgi:hypothetical protein
MARPGRKRKTTVIRDSKGKSRGEVFDPSVIERQPHRRGSAQPWSEDAGFPLGRLRINGMLTEAQMRAGNEYAAVVYAYARTMGIPMGSPRSGSMSECVSTGFYSWEGDRHEVDPEEAAKRVQRIRERYNDCHDTLADLGRQHGRGRNILIVMREVCVQECEEKALWRDEAKIGDLRLGLNAVHRVLLERRG